jgi:hypothetical protein
MYIYSTACSHHASYAKTKLSQTTLSSFCGRIAMHSEGRQRHMEPFSVSYSKRLYQHALGLNSYTIFCYILCFHPLWSRLSNKIGWSMFCRTEAMSVWIQSEIFLIWGSIHFLFHVSKCKRRYETSWCFFHVSIRTFQEYSETTFRTMTRPLLSVFFSLITINYHNIPEYRVYTLRYRD